MTKNIVDVWWEFNQEKDLKDREFWKVDHFCSTAAYYYTDSINNVTAVCSWVLSNTIMFIVYSLPLIPQMDY